MGDFVQVLTQGCLDKKYRGGGLHDIAIANIVWCMAYTRGVGGASYIAQWTCNSIAIVRAMQVGGGYER